MTNTPGYEAADRDAPCTISIRLVWPFVQATPAQQREQLVDHLQERLAVSHTELNDPEARVSLQVAMDLLSESSARDRGVLAAQKVTVEQIGVVEYLARTQETLGDALQCGAQYLRLLCDGLHQRIDVRNELAFVSVWFDGNLVVPAAVYEFAMAALLRTASRIAGVPELVPLEVHFMHLPPADSSFLRQVFGGNLRFNQPNAQIVLAAETLKIRLSAAEPALSRLLERHAKSLLANLPRNDDLATMVRDLLRAEPALCDASATRLALRLGMSVRTLARRLSTKGTSFRILLDEARMNVAFHDLAHTMRSIGEIAHQLGFASSQSFHRAFRRWTGSSVDGYRERARRRKLLQSRTTLM